MKTLKFVSITFFCLVCMGTIIFNSGCSGLTPADNSPCLDIAPDASKICEITGNPQDLAFLLKLANVGAMKRDVYKAEQALEMVDFLIKTLEPGTISYSGLMDLLGKKVDPVLFVVLSEYKAQFMALDIPILPYDLELILLHLNKQRNIILMAREAYARGTGKGNTMDLARGSAGPYLPECSGGSGPMKPVLGCDDEGSIKFSGSVITGTGGGDRLYLACGTGGP